MHSASELSGFTCTSSPTMNGKFEYRRRLCQVWYWKFRVHCQWMSTSISCICHITPILEDLHWLPIKYRIEFKIVLLTFKCLFGLTPQCLVDLIAVAAQGMQLCWCQPTHGAYLHLVTEPFSRLLRNCGTVFRRRSETFRPSHLLNELSNILF